MEEDPRFSHIVNDPKFRRIPKGSTKIKIDDRFKSMFKDKRFNVKYSVDKRGRPVSHTTKEDLKRYYELGSEESDSEDEKGQNGEQEVGKFVRAPKNDEDSSFNELEKKHKSDKSVPDNVKRKLKNLNIDYARGESNLFSESSSDDESEEEDLEDEGIEHKWGEFDADAETTEEATKRLAACNMDWDRIRAVDLMVLFNSFLPAGSTIESVCIYPSEFGLQRMKEEEVKGPIELVESQKQEPEGEETEEGSRYHMEKLREYQLNRLKYYYAIITFDSVAAANKIYTECEGMEYESTATKLDLRFVPDDMTFDQEPKEVCTNLPDMAKYQPRFFTTTALQQAKVDLTWDETNPDRIELTEKLNSGKIDDIDDADLQDYLASSSGGESESEKSDNEVDDNASTADPISKYRALLESIEESERKKAERDIQMEVRWDVDLKEKSEKLVKQKLAEKEEKTPFEQYLEKRKAKKKEKKKQRKSQDDEDSEDDSDIPDGIDMSDPYFAEEFNKPEFKKKAKPKKEDSEDDDDKPENNDLELLVWNEDEDNKKHFSLGKIQEQENKKGKKKRKKKKEEEVKDDNFNVNVNDERFTALFTSHHYNIDPTNPHFKKTKAMETLIEEKLKRRSQADEDVAVGKKPKLAEKKNPELSMLVKSVKQKAQAFNKKNS